MANSGLQHSVKNYEDALRELTETLSKSDARLDLLEEKLLRVLVARDVVQTHLISEAPVSVYDLKKICALDDWSESIKEAVAKAGKLEKWQKVLKPFPESWWWFPKALTHPLDRFDWAWSGLSFFFLLISFGLCTNVAIRFFMGGSDPVGITLIAAQSVLGFLSAKGSIPLVLQEQIQKTVGTARLSKHWQQEIRCILALLFLAVSIGFYKALPSASNFYFWRGVDEENHGHLGSAQNKYNRAILLNSENTSAHYNLGYLYEKMQMPDRARLEYKIATTQNGNLFAYSNLARLEILDKKYSEAVALASEGLKKLEFSKTLKADKDEKKKRNNVEYVKNAEYALRKNLGWVRLEQKRYEEAQKELEKSVYLSEEMATIYLRQGRDDLSQKRAAPHCLIAQVFEAKNQKTESLLHWKECAQLSNEEIERQRNHRFPIDEDSWLGQANECLKPQYRSKQCLEERKGK